ncbi:PRELI domain-containing protein 2-like [Eriocheir sinensis]|uniref:PRELI domain-containing protein 2-like n=1 Tax=Eriocheir sinensis TaxID=95602 RepID=UPI0021C9F90F|nr:PRELI domain-containing protein 2-like [Eriocheir sinensis]XP_050692088.1 PRELI domain-containing protein 2-like [Eriocheir sinensis]XP_050692090.1 PRELI domain-containing protein 2-like [Eriocheir sinensis]XP_050692091.1 PRELI domain-containing protein 2-like [Eriocheir sinensis]XP_050692092.1 PRELI domain-containing protein 2-like [Eriocheir sinensis]XP_050692093.1 PRELI domain-containing protein 2-like [Eriocheir sinensis]XP_050692094.1 PRELI domain-containing protein 2-like [Eriocheir 
MTVTVTAEHVYQEPVEVVAATHLTKFPNEHDPNILSCNVVERKPQEDGRAYTKRVAAVRNVLPDLLRQVKSLQQDELMVEEECWWDWKTRKFDVKSRNLSASDWITLSENSSYTPYTHNTNWTKFEQEGTITVHGLGTLGYFIEMFSKRFLSAGAQRSIAITEKLMAEKAKRITSCWYSEFLFA